MENDYYIVEKAIRYINKHFKEQPSLEEISSNLGLSPFHFQKVFKRWAGISPKKFLQFITLQNSKEILKSTLNIYDAAFESGLSSVSRLNDLFVNFYAITPAEYKKKGKDIKVFYGFHETKFGKVLIAITGRGICSLKFVKDKNAALNELKKEWKLSNLLLNQKRTNVFIDKVFNNNEKLDIFVKGTNFQIQVWKALITIPNGKLTTYEQVAKNIKNPKALRAVGTAIGANPISYLIPCHRVINKTLKTGNYRWGKERKQAVLALEQISKKKLT